MPKKNKEQDLKSEWYSVFDRLAAELGAYEAWRSWIYLTGANMAFYAGNRIPSLMSQHDSILEKLTDQQKKWIDELNIIMGKELDLNPFQDYIGQRYMETELAEGKSKGQHFTPYQVSKMMAELSFLDKETIDQEIQEKGFYCLDDCAIGAGSLMIAILEKMKREGYNIHSQVWISGTDVSEITLLQAYIQLSLIGAAGVLCVGDTIYDKYSYHLLTPAACYPGWVKRKQKYGLPNPRYQLHDAKNWRRSNEQIQVNTA